MAGATTIGVATTTAASHTTDVQYRVVLANVTFKLWTDADRATFASVFAGSLSTLTGGVIASRAVVIMSAWAGSVIMDVQATVPSGTAATAQCGAGLMDAPLVQSLVPTNPSLYASLAVTVTTSNTSIPCPTSPVVSVTTVPPAPTTVGVVPSDPSGSTSGTPAAALAGGAAGGVLLVCAVLLAVVVWRRRPRTVAKRAVLEDAADTAMFHNPMYRGPAAAGYLDVAPGAADSTYATSFYTLDDTGGSTADGVDTYGPTSFYSLGYSPAVYHGGGYSATNPDYSSEALYALGGASQYEQPVQRGAAGVYSEASPYSGGAVYALGAASYAGESVYALGNSSTASRPGEGPFGFGAVDAMARHDSEYSCPNSFYAVGVAPSMSSPDGYGQYTAADMYAVPLHGGAGDAVYAAADMYAAPRAGDAVYAMGQAGDGGHYALGRSPSVHVTSGSHYAVASEAINDESNG